MNKSSGGVHLLKPFILLLILASCAGKYSMPENTLRIMVEAAKQNDVDRLIECWDLQWFRNIVLAKIPPDLKLPDKVIDSLVKEGILSSPNFTFLINMLRNSNLTVLDEQELANDTKELTIRIVPISGTDVQKEDKTHMVFVRRDHAWKFSFGKTIDLIESQ